MMSENECHSCFSCDRYLRSPTLAKLVEDLKLVAYPVELGMRLRELIFPVQKMYDDCFDIDPDARAYLEEFIVSRHLLCLFRLYFGVRL